MAETAAQGPPCVCARGSNGRCPACVATIGALVKQLADQMIASQRRMQETISAVSVCNPCAREQMDLAIAEAVASLARDASGPYAAQRHVVVGAAMMLVDGGQKQGVTDYPLTQRAIAEAFAQ